MIDISQKKENIVAFLKQNGPSLPVRIAKKIEMDPVFASAILSELLGEKRVKLSNMRIGSSPLYLIPGEENRLENLTENLKIVERNALEKLKDEKILKDEILEPQIRVALRNLRDFATPFKFEEKIMWRYSFSSEEEIRKLLIPEKEKIPEKENIKINEKEKSENEIKSTNTKINEKSETAYEKKISKEKEERKIEKIFEEKPPKNPEFLNEIKRFLEKRNLNFLEEIQTGKKEIVAKISVPSNLKEIHFLLIAKNKKTISKEEISTCLQRARYNKMPCLILMRKEPTKSINQLINENHLIKLEVI